MLAAILLNLPRLTTSGPFHGFAPGRVASGTAWNKDWSKKYGPDSRKPKREIKRAEVKAVFEAIADVDLPQQFSEARDIADAYSLNELFRDQAEAHYLMVIYAEYMIWRNEEEEIAILLLTI